MGKTHYAEYGNAIIKRGWCNYCNGYAFIIDDIIQCCNRPYNQNSDKLKKMAECIRIRKLPSAYERKQILKNQQYRCLYCDKEFGEHAYRNGKIILLKINWDHKIPFAYSMNNNGYNFCAACHICNSIKSSFMFETLEEAKAKIMAIRKQKGYQD